MFVPGSGEAVPFDLAMRRSLAASLDHIGARWGSELDLPPRTVAAALERIAAHRVRPGVFGRYYRLVLAIDRGDLASARSLFLGLAELARDEARFAVLPFTERGLGDEMALYGDLIDQTPGQTPWMVPPSPEQAAGFADKVAGALDIIALADPHLAREIRGLTIEVVGAAPFQGPNARHFGSGSSLMLWGLIVLNLTRYDSAAKLVDPLVHEAAHQLLYAHSIDEPLVTNPVDEHFASPLRDDRRPMDGVFHATFVAARLHYANRKLRDAAIGGRLIMDIAGLDARREILRRQFFEGLRTVRDFGRLTATGARIIEEASDDMRAG